MTFFVSQEMNCFWARFLGGNPLREIPIHWTKNICRCFCTFAENLGKFLRFRAAFLRLILRSCLDSTRSFWAAQPCLFWRIGYLSFPWCWEKGCLSYRGIWSDSPSQRKGILQTTICTLTVHLNLLGRGQSSVLQPEPSTTGQKNPRREPSFPALVPWWLLVWMVFKCDARGVRCSPSCS